MANYEALAIIANGFVKFIMIFGLRKRLALANAKICNVNFRSKIV